MDFVSSNSGSLMFYCFCNISTPCSKLWPEEPRKLFTWRIQELKYFNLVTEFTVKHISQPVIYSPNSYLFHHWRTHCLQRFRCSVLVRWYFTCSLPQTGKICWAFQQSLHSLWQEDQCREDPADDKQHQWHQHRDLRNWTEAWDSHKLQVPGLSYNWWASQHWQGWNQFGMTGVFL